MEYFQCCFIDSVFVKRSWLLSVHNVADKTSDAHRKHTEQCERLLWTLALSSDEEARNFDVPQILREQQNQKRRPGNTTAHEVRYSNISSRIYGCYTERQNEQNAKPVEIAGLPQIGQPISAVSGPKFAIFWGHVEAVLLLNKFFSYCWCMP